MKNMMQSVTQMKARLVKEMLKTKVDTTENNVIGAGNTMGVNKHDQEIEPVMMENPLTLNNQFIRQHVERNRGGCMRMR